MRTTTARREPGGDRAKRIVVLARLVDADGRLVRARDVAAIHYTLYEVLRIGRDGARIFTIRAYGDVNVTEVLSDTLRSDKHWTVDAFGYNFRHDIDVSALRLAEQFEVHYVMRPTLSPKTPIHLNFRSDLR
jgi:hypothetical protein